MNRHPQVPGSPSIECCRNGSLIEEKFRARDLALTVALGSLEKRLDGMNEFRDTLRDQNTRYMTRAEYNAAHDALAKTNDQLRVELAAYAVRVEQTDKSAALDRATLDKRLDAMNEFRGQLRDQAATFSLRAEAEAKHEATKADIRRLEMTTAACMSKEDHEKLADRVKAVETQLATWNGRLWALGTVFLLMNVFVSWYLSGIHVSPFHP